MLRSLVLLLLWACLARNAFCAETAKVEYISEHSKTDLAQPLSVVELCSSTASILGLTNGRLSDETLIGWAVKKSDSDQPPFLQEEALICFRVADSQTNQWIIACVSRVAARGAPGRDVWDKAAISPGMQWVQMTPNKPTVKELTGFIQRSNFGNNECKPYIKTIYVAIYAPYKSLVKAASKSVNQREKERRFNSTTDIIR